MLPSAPLAAGVSATATPAAALPTRPGGWPACASTTRRESTATCNCSGHSDECFYDRELYRSTGHGGRCLRCRDNTAGPRCERCQPNHYRWDGQAACQPCHCNAAGSLQLQCDSAGACACKANVTGWKCERCKDGFHSLGDGGCRDCGENGAER
uniref:Laminin EGF-like domain-containing protein n=1 Tax=Apteryx owenii TaxID=8824 RepID=A0A8B9PLG5_APTOW